MMEKFALTLQSQSEIDQYIGGNHLMRYEREILAEISAVIITGDQAQLSWFAGFGDSFRQIMMNVNEYRKGLEFGFTESAFNQYGWFASPKFLDFEEITLEQSIIRLGRGVNFVWTYALSCTYGMAGSSGPLSVFCPKFSSREAALSAALDDLKGKLTDKAGHTDHSNYNQEVILKTLKAICRAQVGLVQLSLF